MKLTQTIERIGSGLLDQADSRRRFRILVILSACLLLQVSPYWIPTPDAAAYLSIAGSMAGSKGLTCFGSPHIYYPPGYPAAISPLFRLFGLSFLSISVAHWCLLVLFLSGSYVWAKRVVPEYALPIAILSSTNVGVLYLFRRTLSEAVFMPLLMWSAVALDTLADRRPTHRMRILLIAAIAVAYLCVVRQAGMALPLGFGCVVLHQAFKRQAGWLRGCRDAGVVVACAVLAAGMLTVYDRTMAQAVGAELTYSAQVSLQSAFGSQFLHGLVLRIQEVGRLLIPGAFKIYGSGLNPCMLLYVPCFAAVCFGWFRMVRTRPNSLCCAFPFYLGLYLIWTYDQGCRFMTPFVPVFWAALVTLARPYVEERRLLPVMVVVILLSMMTALAYWAGDLADGRKQNRAWRSLDAICRRLPAGSDVCSLLTSRPDQQMLRVRLDRPVRSVQEAGDLPPACRFAVAGTNATLPDRFSTVFRNGPFLLLQRAGDTDGASPR